jgi:hypothetical protein
VDYMIRTAGVRFPTGGRDFPILCSVQTGSVAHSASYAMDTGAPFPEVKRPGREANHSPASSAEVKNGGAVPPQPRNFKA